MSAPSYFEGLDAAAFAASLADAPPALRAARERAFADYGGIPAPAGTDEEWRRTDPARIPFGRARLAAAVPAAAAAPAPAPEHAFYDVVVTVSEEGVAIEDRSGALREGRVVVERFEDRARRAPEDFAAQYRGPAIAAAVGAPAAPDKIEAMIGAFAAAGLWIDVPPGVSLDRGILVHHRWRRPDTLAAWRIAARVGAGGALALDEWIDGGGAGGILASAREFTVGEGAKARTLLLQQADPAATVLTVDGARIGRDGAIDAVAAHFGAGFLRSKTAVELAGGGAHARMGGVALLDGTRHADQKTLQIHSAADTTSDLLYRAVVKDAARSVFQGVIVARRGAQRIDAYQRNNNLLLNDGARADSLPGLLIDADDLKCTHGSTIGHLDPEALFYLRTRGIAEPAARRLLIEAFADAIFSRCPPSSLRDRMRAALAAGL